MPRQPRPDPAAVAGCARRLRDLREAKGWTYAELARRAGLSSKAVERIERGEHRPYLDTLRALAAALGTDFAELALLAGYRQ